AYPPNLVVIDGGPAQVDAAVRALDELGIDDIAVCGLAKRLEEVWLPGEDAPVNMARSSEGLYLLQRVRDEAHRFAITYHRAKRSKAMAVSELDGVPGLGPARRATLLRHFGSVRKIAGATEAEIAEVPGIGPRLASAVLTVLSPGQQSETSDRGASGDTGIGRSGPHERQTGRGRDGEPAGRCRDHHRNVGRGEEHDRQVPGGPGLVRHREPSAGPAANHDRPGDAGQRNPAEDRRGH